MSTTKTTPQSAAKSTVARRKTATKTAGVAGTKAPSKTAPKRTATKKTTPLASSSVDMTLTKMPSGNGGVRFDAATKDLTATTVYVKQDVWKALGEPTAITVTVAAK